MLDTQKSMPDVARQLPNHAPRSYTMNQLRGIALRYARRLGEGLCGLHYDDRAETLTFWTTERECTFPAGKRKPLFGSNW